MDPNDHIEDEDAAFVGDDVLEVIDIDDRNDNEAALDDMAEMDLDDEADYDGEEMTEGTRLITPSRDDSALSFTKHTDSVLCVSIDPSTGSMVASGSQDDSAYLWKVSNGDILLHCQGHRDSVSCVGFSSDSKLLATGDMSGLIKVWNVETGKEIWSFEVSDLEWLRWHKAAHVLLAGTSDGMMWLWKIPSQEFKTFTGPGVKCTVGEFLPDGKRAVVGYEDGTMKVWDLKSGSALVTSGSTSQGHQETITCVACHHDNRLVLTGSTDMLVLLTNTENGKILARFDCKNLVQQASGGEGSEDSVEAVGFSPSNSFNYAAAGTLSGVLVVLDMSSQSIRHKLQHKEGIVKLCWDSTEPHIYTCSLDACLYVWDARYGSMLKQFEGHSAQILDLDLSSDNSKLVSASDDTTVKVFSTKSPNSSSSTAAHS